MEKIRLTDEEQVGRLEYEFLSLMELREELGDRKHNSYDNKKMIDEVNDALIDVQKEHRMLSGHYFYPSNQDIRGF